MLLEGGGLVNRTDHVVKNVWWGSINRILSLVFPFVSRSVILYKFGTLYLGMGSLFSSVIGMLSLAELGFSSAITFSMYTPMAQGDDDKVCALLAFYKKCYRMIGMVILLIGLALLPFLRSLISGDHPKEINIYLVYLIHLGNTVGSYFLFAYKKSLLQAGQRADVDSKIGAIVMLFQYPLQIGVALAFGDYYIYVLVLPLSVFANNLLTAYVTEKLYPQFVCRGRLTQEDYVSLKVKLGGLIFQKIGNIVLGSVDNIVISAFLGLTVLANYNNYYCIIAGLFGFIGVVSNSLKASVGNAFATESQEYNLRQFQVLNLMYTMMISWVSLCFLCLVQPFISLWLGSAYLLPDGIALLAAVYIFIFKWCDMLYVYQEAKGIWWQTKFIPLVAAMVNLVVNIALVNTIGLAGILLSTIVSVLFVYDHGYARVLFRELFVGRGNFRRYLFQQGYYMAVEGILLALCYISCVMCRASGLFMQFVQAIGCAVAGSLLLVLAYAWQPEFKDAYGYVKNMIDRNKKDR